MPSIFESFLRGQQAAQAQALNQLKLQQAQQIDPIQQQLQQLELQRAQQQLALGQKELEGGGLTEFQRQNLELQRRRLEQSSVPTQTTAKKNLEE